MGRSTSSTWSTSGGPYRSWTTAFTIETYADDGWSIGPATTPDGCLVAAVDSRCEDAAVQNHGRVGRLAQLATLALAALIAVACVGRQNVPTSSVAPSTAARSAPVTSISPRPVSSGPVPKDVGCDAIIAKQPGPYQATPASLPPPPGPAVAGGDKASSAAITRAIEAIGDLRSYSSRSTLGGATS
jgi:hypothetical protein